MKTKTSSFLVPLVLFVILTALVVLVWRGQVGYEHDILARHTEDVAYQASRRLEIFVESHVLLAEVFATRWASHEEGDYSKRRFMEFSRVLLAEVGVIHSVLVAPGEAEPFWKMPLDAQVPGSLVDSVLGTGQSDGTTVSGSAVSASGERLFLVSLPLEHEELNLGRMAVVFNATSLVDNCFESSIRREFEFVVKDGGEVLFRHAPAGGVREIQAVHAVAVRDRPPIVWISPRP